MTAISKYYAEVGVGLDHKSLRSVQAYFKNIERTMNNFRKRMERTQSLSIRAKVDNAALLKSLRTATTKISKSVVVPLTRFNINEKGLARALNKAMSSAKFSKDVRFGAMLSRTSLTNMRTQIRQALEGTIIRPRINPTIAGGNRFVGGSRGSGGYTDGIRSSDPRNTRRMSPWHNPMMIGGGAGAFLRYGAFSLPFIGGVLGLNALNTFASEQAAQRTSLNMVSDMSTVGRTSDENRAFLKELAQTTGKSSMSMTPIYTQMLAASTGTELEQKMPDMFSGIMQYASVMGLGEESIKRAMTGFERVPHNRNVVMIIP